MIPHFRWMIEHDYPDVLAIEATATAAPWNEQRLLKMLRERNVIGMVAENDERVIGHYVYELEKFHINVLRFAVDPAWRGQGVGWRMLDKLRGKLLPKRYTSLRFIVPESADDMCCFLKSNGIPATQVLRDWFDGRDGYEFVDRFSLERVAKHA